MKRENSVAQGLAIILGLIGMYLAGIALMTIYGALQAGMLIVFMLATPILIVGIIMLVFSYKAIYRPSEINSKNTALVYAVITLLYAGSIIERMIPDNDVVANPRVIASGSTIILTILVFFGVKKLLNIESKKKEETQ